MSVASDKAVHIASKYLGPSAREFIERQCNHLGIPFSDLGGEHIPDLAAWVWGSATKIIDREKAIEFSNEIKAI